jgi:hypothetical protein
MFKWISRFKGVWGGRRNVSHKHDYEMEFVGAGLNFRLVCKCGDVAPNMDEAVNRMAKG